MNTAFVTPFVDHVWKLNLQASLLAVIVAVVCLVGRCSLTPGWRSILWMLVFVRLVVPFGPASMFSLGNLANVSLGIRSADIDRIDANATETKRPDHETTPVRPAIESVARPLVPDIDTAPAGITKMATETSSTWSAREVCTAIWLVGAAFLLARLGWLKTRLSHYLSRLEVISQPEVIRLAESIASTARLNRVPRLLWGSPQCSPAVCGWWSPVLILPSDSTVLQPSRLRAVLLHEFRHVRTADTLLTWLPRVLCATFWFNPLFWYAGRKWHEERELSCDEWVLRQIGQDQKRTYLETLMAIATGSSLSPMLELTASIVSSSTTLERRIVAMKRFRPVTRTGLIAGAVLTLVIAAIGLTDAAQAENESVKEQKFATFANSKTDQNTGTQVPNQQQADQEETAPVASQAKTLKPKIVFAQQAILWEWTEILTRDQLQERLAELRATQIVKPSVYFSLGFVASKGIVDLAATSEEEASERANKAIGESMELIGRDWTMMSFLSRRGSGAVDRIRTTDDLKINPARSLKGRVVVSRDVGRAAGLGSEGKPLLTTAPVKGAQVVILPLGEPCFIRLRDGKLREPEEEIWYETDAEGRFQADPASLVFDPVLLFGDGKYLTLILHEAGYGVINGQLAASDATYELLPWREVTIDPRNLKEDEQIEIWMTPAGVHEKFPAVSIGWVGHGDRPVAVKLPRGKGHVAYWRKVDDQWHDTEVRHPIQVTADSPAEILLSPGPVKSG
ncbi:MAG TPA: M56 family metallopeptidase [Pirellulales bacterium]|nr:M56 family metallopeptidase [Pirellulales bacterium]